MEPLCVSTLLAVGYMGTSFTRLATSPQLANQMVHVVARIQASAQQRKNFGRNIRRSHPPITGHISAGDTQGRYRVDVGVAVAVSIGDGVAGVVGLGVGVSVGVEVAVAVRTAGGGQRRSLRRGHA